MKCVHGCEIGAQSAVDDIRSWEENGTSEVILEFYSACDCCDYLMHKSYAGVGSEDGYEVCADGRTLCYACQTTQKGDAK